MSNARNLGNVGARLQQTQSVGLSAGGNIKAVTFQGSGKLLTDLLQLTGGNINIAVGSTRQFTNLQSALDSLSSYIFDDTANVKIILDNETFNVTSPINLSHDYGSTITIQGAGDYNFESQVNNPIYSVAGVNTSTLSATINLKSTSDLPAVGDYVNIFSVSARSAGLFVLYQTIDTTVGANKISSLLTNSTIPIEWPTSDTLNMMLTEGSKTLITTLCSYASMTSVVRTISSITSTGSTAVVGNTIYSFVENTPPYENFITAGGAPAAQSSIIFAGNPESYRATTFTQVSGGQLAEEATLTFADGVATNTWLNAGDVIFALGQTSVVRSVSSTNRCTISYPFKTWNASASALQSTTLATSGGATPFLVKTMAERYRGCHRVVAVNGASSPRRVTLEIYDYGFANNGMAPSTTQYSYGPVSGFPLPEYGISSIGNEIYVKRKYLQPNQDPIVGYYPKAKILKTKLNFANLASTKFASPSAGTAMFLNDATIKLMDNMVFVNNGGEAVGTGLLVGGDLDSASNKPSTIGLGLSGIAFSGKFISAIRVNGSIINANNLGITSAFPNWASVSDVQYYPNYANCTIDIDAQSQSTFNYVAVIANIPRMNLGGISVCKYINMANCWVFNLIGSSKSETRVTNIFASCNYGGYTHSSIYFGTFTFACAINTHTNYSNSYGLFAVNVTLNYGTINYGWGVLHSCQNPYTNNYVYSFLQWQGDYYPVGGRDVWYKNCVVGKRINLGYGGYTFDFQSNGGDGGWGKFYLFDQLFFQGTQANVATGESGSYIMNSNFIADSDSLKASQANSYLLGGAGFSNLAAITTGTTSFGSITGLDISNGTTFIPPIRTTFV